MSIKRRIIKRNRKYLMKQGEIVAEFKKFSSSKYKYYLRYKNNESFISIIGNNKYDIYKEAVNSLKYLKKEDNEVN